MSKLHNLKLAATVVGSVAGIVSGIDKIKSIFHKWRQEYSGDKPKENIEKEVPPVE